MTANFGSSWKSTAATSGRPPYTERPQTAKSGLWKENRNEWEIMSRVTKLVLIGVALTIAITLTLWSVNVERIGPELVVYGNLCGPSGFDFCYKPVLKGGFPVAYLFDASGISVERQLAFFEDNLSVGALVLDVAFYFAIVLLAMLAVLRCWSALKASASSTKA